MSSATLISIEEYLSTSYRPDRDFVDGRILERKLGERDHSRLQTELSSYLNSRRKQWAIWVYVEQRVQVQPTRFRVPDICVVAGSQPEEQVFRKPPFICVEILSKDDRMEEMQERIDDYLAFGVRYVWLLNPRTRRAYFYTMEGTREVKDGFLRTENPQVVVPLAEIFAES
ncbi:MAG: Uma2 family endonuclease [Acidobacteria bacterium]|nr:Uma2 family endonuclease [Acidobacteriota bacterium]